MADSDSLWCERAADNTIGPAVASCARAFDFTLLFEQFILCLPVQILFLLLVPWRTFNLRKSRSKIRRSWMSFGKPVATLPLIATQVFLLVLYCNNNTIRTQASIPATALSLVTSLLLGPFSCIEHHRSVRPSTLLNCWLVLSIILDIPQTRTLYLIPGAFQLAAVFSAALAAKLLLLLLEAWDKTPLIIENKALPSETTSGVLSRTFFLWLNALFWRGYRKVISFDDLDPIDSSLRSSLLHESLERAWIQRKKDKLRWPLLRSLWKALRWSLLSAVPPRLCYSGFLFAQPFLIDRATSYLGQKSDDGDDNIGYGLIGATGCIYLGIAVNIAQYHPW